MSTNGSSKSLPWAAMAAFGRRPNRASAGCWTVVRCGADRPSVPRALDWAAALAEHAPFGVKTTEAPHYLRVVTTRRRAARLVSPSPNGAAGATRSARPDAIGRARRAVTDGNGFVFIDHVGQICPSGFLPIPVGNVRDQDLATVYREDPLFRALRDPARLGGRCGRCEYHAYCGGSRALAYAATGDPLAEDPGCVYQPAAGPTAPPNLFAIAGGSRRRGGRRDSRSGHRSPPVGAGPGALALGGRAGSDLRDRDRRPHGPDHRVDGRPRAG
jgi:radical SAM protein with 4Fe4S-binding SPASM domain